MNTPEAVVTNPPSTKPARPLIITITCILSFLGALIASPLVFSETARNIAPWYAPYLGFSTVVGLVCFVGLWMMKKWAAYAYTAFVAINQVILLATGLWSPGTLLIPAVVIAIMLANVRKMS